METETITIQDCWFTRRDGRSIYAVRCAPLPDGKRHPLVIFGHELCHTHASGLPYLRRLAALGCIGVSVDFCGGSRHSLSEGKLTEMSAMTQAEELEDVLEQASQWPEVDPNCCWLSGGSQGALAAIIAATRHPNEVAGMALLYPAFVIHDSVHRMFGRRENIPDTFSVHGWVDVGRRYAADLWDYDVFTEMPKFENPVLLLHSENDPLVPVEYSRRAAKTFPNATLYIVEGGGHIYRDEAFEEAAAQLVDFVRQHLSQTAQNANEVIA